MSALAAMMAVSASGIADFSTTTTTQSNVGNKVVSDTSYTITTLAPYVATSSDAGSATGTDSQEIGDPRATLRTNAVTSGNFVYKLDLTEASALTSGTWTVKIFEDGTQVGDTITITQAVAVAGTTEGAIILADLGTSVSSTTIFEARMTKTA
jgi:hypothetical protein